MKEERQELFSKGFKDEVNTNFSKLENIGNRLSSATVTMDKVLNRENPHDTEQEYKNSFPNVELLKNLQSKLRCIGKTKEKFTNVYVKSRLPADQTVPTFVDSNLCTRCFKKTADIEEKVKEDIDNRIETPRSVLPKQYRHFGFDLDERMWDILNDHENFEDDLPNFFKPYGVKELETLI